MAIRNIIPETEDPQLGTTAAAMKGCVDLIARMCEKPVGVVQYWLDLYFQIRLASAVEEDKRRRDAKLIERLQEFVPPEERNPDAGKESSAPESQADKAPAAEDASSADQAGDLAGFEPLELKKQGAQNGNTSSSDAAKFKRETLARLMRLRGDGITIDSIVRASNGNLNDDVVLNILQARKMSIAYYRKLAAALDRIESAMKEG